MAAFLPGGSSDYDYWRTACNYARGHGAWNNAASTCVPDPYRYGK